MSSVNLLARRLVALAGVCLSVSLAATSQAETECEPLSIATCAMPFPSNHYTTADSGSPTGVRVSVPDTIVSQDVLDRISDSFRPNAVFSGRSGFSAAGPVLFELDDAINPDTLPEDGGSSVVVFDLDTGQRVPITTNPSKLALENAITPTMVVEVFPRSRFAYGHRFVAAITRDIKRIDDTEFSAAPALQALLNGQRPDLQASYLPLLAFLESQGLDSADVLSVTEFTVSDEEEIRGPLDVMVEKVREQPHPVRDLRIIPIYIGPVAAVVQGELLLTDFRREDGSIQFDPDYDGVQTWVEFDMVLPMASRYGPAPIMIYGHGLSAPRQSMIIVGYPNAERGIATIVIDQPNHGSRSAADGGDFLEVAEPETVSLVMGAMMQSPLDLHSVLQAVQNEIAAMDLLPRRNNFLTRLIANILYRSGINQPDIDVNRIYYGGTSLGGVLGSTFVASAPEIKGAYFQITGAGLGNISSHSAIPEFGQAIPPEATGSEAALAVSLIQHTVDIADGINHADKLRFPQSGEERPVVIQYGLDDLVVVNNSSYAMAELAGLPHIRAQGVPTAEFLPEADDLVDGSGLLQTPPGLVFDLGRGSSLAINADAHATSLANTDTFVSYLDWLDRVILGEE